MRHLILSSLLLALTACAGNPRNDSDAKTLRAERYENEAQAREAAGRDDLICTYEKAVGSHMKKAICMTKAEREALAEGSRESAARAQRPRNASTGGDIR